ncbi:hypothetical protein AB0K09_26990 [Streptomyces sp. NPDC049577]|uniref:hypothetical protein n=1 Tax=Streptomyces sp. NPDC049577 TaxID=3155153 RepID=UPI003431359F
MTMCDGPADDRAGDDRAGAPVPPPGQPPYPPPLPPGSTPSGPAGPRQVPATPGEALGIGRRHFPPVGSPGGPISLFVHEFDDGYLIHGGWPAPEDPAAMPAEPGGSHVVISRTDGGVTFVPNFPPERAVEIYHRSRRRRSGTS